MKLIVGLGNPGRIYEQTRHNIGQAAVKELCRRHKAVLKRGLFGSSLSAKCRIGNEESVLAVPLSYMNLSGAAVKPLIKKHKIGLQDLIVILDDLDLELGRLKFKADGSSGGHKGLESIIRVLGTKDFCRLRIGIGRPDNRDCDVSDYVLSVFKKNEKTAVDAAVDEACAAVEHWVEFGVEKTMNIFNR